MTGRMSQVRHDAAYRLAYTPAFDGLRGLAILLVMASHAALPLFAGGFVGVDVFFVLSGFLITALLVQEHARAGRIHFRRFYVRRALRLLPALVVMLMALNLYATMHPSAVGVARVPFDSLVTLLYVSNWAYILAQSSYYLTHTWSLAIEEQFYILFPLLLAVLLRRLPRRRVTWVVGALAGFSCLWGLFLLALNTPWYRIYFGLDTRLWELLAGCALALWLTSRDGQTGPGRTGWTATALAACALIGGLVVSVDGKTPSSAYTALIGATMATIALILVVIHDPEGPAARVFAWRPLVWLGKLSYALYLWHVPVFLIVGYETPEALAVSVGLSLLAAALSYALIEQPFLRLKRRFQA